SIRRIDALRSNLPDASEATIAHRKKMIDAELELAASVRTELEGMLASGANEVRSELNRLRQGADPRTVAQYTPFDSKIWTLHNEAVAAIRESAAMIDYRAKAAKDVLDALQRIGATERPGEKDLKEGKLTRDSARVATHDELSFFAVDHELLQT